MKVILIAKCSDQFVLNAGTKVYAGYVPDCVPRVNSDILRLEIDNDTGTILNWEKISDEDLQALQS